MPNLPLADVTLHYEITGSGPPLLLIPGMLSDHASWAPLVPLLSNRFTLIRPDPRGAGQTHPHDAPLTLRSLSDDMLGLINHLGHSQVRVVGHSLGGLVALALADRAPERVASLAVLASSPLPSARLPFIFRTLCDIRESGPQDLWLRQLFTLLFHDSFFRDPEAVKTAISASLAYPFKQSRSAMEHQTRALGRLDLDALPQKISMPGLALMAEEDALIAPGPASARFAQMGLVVQQMPKVGHSLHWDAPDLVTQALITFLNPDGAGGA